MDQISKFLNSDCSWFLCFHFGAIIQTVATCQVEWLAQDSKTVTLGRRETKGYNQKTYSDCFGDENTLPTAVSPFIQMQNWSISPKDVFPAGTPADVSPTAIQGYQGSHKTLPCVATEVLWHNPVRACLPPHFSWTVAITTVIPGNPISHVHFWFMKCF